MINPDVFLNPNLFKESKIEKKPIRDGYGEGLVEAGESNGNVVALTADLKESTRVHWFAEKFPDRFFEVGVAEQNLATIAAGFGVTGKIAFISSYATFSPGRNWEQIRTTAAYNNSNVKVAGHHAGVSTGPDGATHQAIEDIATMRVIPNMKVFVPCDAIEAKKATVAAAKIFGPVYLRFARIGTPIITTDKTPFIPGKAAIFWLPPKRKSPAVLIVAAGTMVYNALLAAKELEEEGIYSTVINLASIKPIDSATLAHWAKKARAVVSVEEHNVIGGVGGAVAEVLAQHQPTAMEYVGMKDTFGESGEPDQLIKKYGMDVSHIKRAVKKVIKKR